MQFQYDINDVVQMYNIANTLGRLGLKTPSSYTTILRKIANSGGKYATVNDRGYIVTVGVRHSARQWGR